MKASALEFYGSWFVFFLYLILFLYSSYLYLRKKAHSSFFILGCIGTFLIHGVLIVERWIRVGHGPYLTNYEVFFSNAWMVMASLLLIRVFVKRETELLTLSGLVGTIIFLLFALKRYTPEAGVPSKYFYIWLVIHVFFNKLTLGLVLLTLGYSIYLILKREDPKKEELLQRILMLVLVGWTFTIVSGALWAQEKWGRFWGWDPIETWSLILWFFLALLIHSIKFFKIKGRPLGLLLLISIVLFIGVTAFLPYLVKTIHTMYLLGGE